MTGKRTSSLPNCSPSVRAARRRSQAVGGASAKYWSKSCLPAAGRHVAQTGFEGSMRKNRESGRLEQGHRDSSRPRPLVHPALGNRYVVPATSRAGAASAGSGCARRGDISNPGRQRTPGLTRVFGAAADTHTFARPSPFALEIRLELAPSLPQISRLRGVCPGAAQAVSRAAG